MQHCIPYTFILHAWCKFYERGHSVPDTRRGRLVCNKEKKWSGEWRHFLPVALEGDFHRLRRQVHVALFSMHKKYYAEVPIYDIMSMIYMKIIFDLHEPHNT